MATTLNFMLGLRSLKVLFSRGQISNRLAILKNEETNRLFHLVASVGRGKLSKPVELSMTPAEWMKKDVKALSHLDNCSQQRFNTNSYCLHQDEWETLYTTSISSNYVSLQNMEDYEVIPDIDPYVRLHVCQKLQQGDAGRLFAVVQIGGHQRKITTEDIIVVQKHLTADVGERIQINKVLLVGSKDFTLVGHPLLSNAMIRVEATIVEKTLSHAKIMFWYHRRKNHRKFYANKYPFTMLRINTIEIASPLPEGST